jgi:hypothetical protein
MPFPGLTTQARDLFVQYALQGGLVNDFDGNYKTGCTDLPPEN